MESQKATSRKDEKPHDKNNKKNFIKKKDKFGRKRSKSFSGGGSNGNFCPPYKCRKRPMLPTKFLLGGNICDPLNLNSLQDEEINRTVNAVTPKSSPIPTPPQRRGHIEVIIPPNIHDPLNLIDCADDAEYEQQLQSPLKKGSKRRKKKKRTSSATTETSDADISSSASASASEAKTPDVALDSAKIPPDIDSSVVTSSSSTSVEDTTSPKEKLAKVTRDLKLELSPPKDKKRKSDTHKDNNVKKIRRFESMDKIVSPVVPQPGAWLKRTAHLGRGGPGPSGRGPHNHRNNQKASATTTGPEKKLPQFKEKNKAYQFGNYNRYYGYRNPNHDVDPRLRCFAAYRDIFIGKDILDIGCNIGHITLSIARDFGAKSIVGLDIDKKLIGIARKNIRHYVNCNESPRAEQQQQQQQEPKPTKTNEKTDKFFPISMPILYGPVDIPGMQNDEVKGKGFPHNVSFVQGNYVLEDDSLISTEQPQFDIILCLSITKWMHLNWGDAGLKQAFRRMYAQLRPGGKLILEPQSWTSYKHKKNLTEIIHKNYHTIEFFPEKFTQYLLSSEVGFAKAEIMGHPHHLAKGFQRPIQIFTKSDLSPSQSQRSYSVTPSHTITSAAANSAKPVYSCLTLPDHEEVSSPPVFMTPSSSNIILKVPTLPSTSTTAATKKIYTCITSPTYESDDGGGGGTNTNTNTNGTDENSNQNESFIKMQCDTQTEISSSAKCNMDSKIKVTKNSIKRKLCTSTSTSTSAEVHEVSTNKRTCIEATTTTTACETTATNTNTNVVNLKKQDQKATTHLECKDDDVDAIIIECDKTVDASNENNVDNT